MATKKVNGTAKALVSFNRPDGTQFNPPADEIPEGLTIGKMEQVILRFARTQFADKHQELIDEGASEIDAALTVFTRVAVYGRIEELSHQFERVKIVKKLETVANPINKELADEESRFTERMKRLGLHVKPK